MASIFSKIAAGEIPSYKCAESDKFYAFLDISPIGKGHTLVIPRKEVDYIFDMEDQDLAEFEVFAKKVAKAIKAAFPCKKVAQVVFDNFGREATRRKREVKMRLHFPFCYHVIEWMRVI